MIYNDLEEVRKHRVVEHEIAPIIFKRWSPRAMSGESIETEVLMSLFESAKWAPSSYNEQPWRFLYATRDSENWSAFFDLLTEFNQQWTKNASALILVLSRNNFTHNDNPNVNHSFDSGAAWQNIALEASERGLVAHGMAGFNSVKAREALKVPEGYSIEAMIAIGKPGKTDDLPEAMQAGEVPSGRKKIEEIAKEGVFTFEN